MMATVKTLIRYMLDAHLAYGGTGMMMALYFVALMNIVFLCKDKKIKKKIVVPSVLILFFVYIVIPIYNTFVKYLMYYDGRFFWLLFTPIIISLAFTLFVEQIESEGLRYVCTAFICIVFVYCGKLGLSNAYFHKTQNAYRLPQETIDITEHILEEYEEPKIAVSYTIAHPFRQISSKVHILFGENADDIITRIYYAPEFNRIHDEMERVTPDLNYIVPLCRENNVNYILFDTVYTEFCEDGNINIYGYPTDENYVGDRTSTVKFDELKPISVVDDETGIYWDLSEYGLTYDGTYGQYILYRFD